MSLFNKLRAWLAQNKYFYTLIHRFDSDYRQALGEMKHTTAKTQSEIRREMDLLEDYWHIAPIHYVRYRLFEKKLDADGLLDYVPPYYFYHNFMPAAKSPVKRGFPLSKIGFARIFAERGVPAPQTLGIVSSAGFKALNEAPISANEMFSSLSVGEHIFIKPNYGAGGFGIMRGLVVDQGVLEINGNTIAFEQLPAILDKDKYYVVQRELRQREDLSQINSSSINTLRAITLTVDGKVELKCAIMRIARSGSFVDNSAQGGMSIAIDVETGKFADSAVTEHGNHTFSSHPDSGFVFAGKHLGGWPQIKDAIIEVATKFPEFVIVGWDVALTDDGISVIEMNESFGITHVQCTVGGVRRVFGIYPD